MEHIRRIKKCPTRHAQQFKLYKIIDAQSYSDLLEENPNGANEFSSDTKYPFFIIKPMGNTERSLAYEPGNLFTMPTADYMNQKMDVSQMASPKVSVLTHTML